MARRTAVLDDRQIRQMLGRFSGQRGLPNIGPVGGISPDYATPGTDKLLGRPVDPATGVQSPLTPSQISTALQELSRGSLKQYGLTERDIRRLYRGVNFNLSALSDPYLLNLVRSLLKQGLGMRQIMNDPSFTEYRQSLNEMRETGEQNMATDLSWVEKFRNINKDSFNALLLQNAMGTAAPVVGGGSGGGGGGGGGGRRYGGGGGGGGSGGGGNNPIGEIDVTKDATSNGIEYWPGLNETIRGMGSLPTGDRRALQAYFDRVDAFPNEQAKMRFLDIMGGGQKLPGESQEEYRARRQEAQKFTDLWVRSGGFKGGANAGINSIQDMQDAAQAASETLKARITKTEADAALADTRTRGDFDPRAQQRLMSQLGPRAQEQVTPEIAEYIAAKVARQRVLASQTIPRTAAPTDAELLADPQAASRGAYKPGGFQLDLAAINREVAADKAMREEGITPALLSYIQRSRGIPLAIDPYVGDIVTPRMAYLNQMRSKPDKSRRALATNKEDVDRLGFLYEAAQKFSPNNAAQLQSRTLRESSGEDWKDLPGHHLNDEPPTGPNAGPRDVASYFINSSPQGRRDSTPSARSSVSAVPSNTTPQYHLPQEQQSAPKYGYEQPGGYMAAVQPAIDAEAAKRAAAQRAAAIVAASYGPGSNSMGAAPYSPPSSSSSSSPQRAAAKVISAARKAITYGGGSPAVGITKPSNSLYRTINRY